NISHLPAPARNEQLNGLIRQCSGPAGGQRGPQPPPEAGGAGQPLQQGGQQGAFRHVGAFPDGGVPQLRRQPRQRQQGLQQGQHLPALRGGLGRGEQGLAPDHQRPQPRRQGPQPPGGQRARPAAQAAG